MPRAVLLEHHTPDGSMHYDWMVQRPAFGDRSPLSTFRIWERIDLAQTTTFEAERLPDHRPEYLDLEGPLSGNRGEVRRLCRGDLLIEHDSPSRCTFRGTLGSARGLWEGRARDGGRRWDFVFTTST
jgi:hypothetical protein